MSRAGTMLKAAIAAEQGAAALEFAIIAPVFLLMMTGMIAYGIYFGAAHSVQQLAADAARTSVAGVTDAERESLVQQFLDNNADDYVLIDRDHLAYTAAPKANDASEFHVTLSYDAAALPIWNLYPPLPLPSTTITYSSDVRLGGT